MQNDNLRVTGYKSITKNRISNIGRGIGGVAVFIKNNISVEEIRNIDVTEDEMDCVGLRIKNIEECEEVVMLRIYRPGSTAKKTWRNLLSSLKEEKNYYNSNRRLLMRTM